MKPQNEIVIRFGKDSNGCIIVTVFDVHGAEMQELVKAAGFPSMKLLGKDAIKQTAAIFALMKPMSAELGLVHKAFVAKGTTYLSYTAPASA
jgi:hypothetical protein